MGAVRSSLVLNDGMTPALRKINKAMSGVLNSFEAVQRASGQSFNTAAINQARQAIGQADAALDEMERSYKNCSSGQDELNRRINAGTSAAGGLLGKVKSIASAYLGMRAVKGIVTLSDDITQTTARLGMMNDGLQTTAELQNYVFQAAQASRGSYLDMAASVAKLGNNAGDAFRSTKEIVKFAELTQKQFAIAGASTTEANNAMLQLTQALGSGVLRGDELNSIFEQAPNLIKTIADYMGVGIGQIRSMASEGQITADIVKNAMFASADEIDAKFNQMPKTWSQIWTSMKNRGIKALEPVLAKVNQLANSERVQNTINGLMNAFTTMSFVLAQVFEGVCAVYNFVADNWSWIAPIIGGIVAALIAYKTALAIVNAVEFIGAVAKVAFAGATAAEAAATTTATAAQVSLNAAIWACPITWIIAAIVLLIVLFVIFTKEITGAIWWLGALFKNVGLWIANCGIAAWQVIKNIGMWFANLGASVWAIIKNTGLWFANLGMGIWNVLKAAASNVGVAFNNAWVGIQIGFWKMLDVIMQGLKSLAEKANACLGWMGVNIDTSGLDFAAKKIDALNSKKESYTSISDAWAEGFNTFAYDSVSDAWNSHEYGSVSDAFGTFDTFQDGWGSDAYNAGAEVGAGIQNWMSDNLSLGGIMDKLGLNAGADMGINDYIGYGDTLGDIADNTGATADNTSQSKEELSYLRDIAEKEAINRFTTAEIKVDLGGVTNNVAANTDLDGIISYITDGLSDALLTAAEGVY
jgi:tape measure domain-containing protein